jgi:hypothetical protein
MTTLRFFTNALQALGRADKANALIGEYLLYVLSYGNRWSISMARNSSAA